MVLLFRTCHTVKGNEDSEFPLQWPMICNCCAVVTSCNFLNIIGVSGGLTEEGLDMQLCCQCSIDFKMMLSMGCHRFLLKSALIYFRSHVCHCHFVSFISL